MKYDPAKLDQLLLKVKRKLRILKWITPKSVCNKFKWENAEFPDGLDLYNSYLENKKWFMKLYQQVF